MKQNTAIRYTGAKTKSAGEYKSFYTKLEEFAPIVFYWDIDLNKQKKPPVWKKNKDPIKNMRIIDYNNNSFTIELHSTRFTFKLIDENTFELDQCSLRTLLEMTWLEREIIITQSTTNDPQREMSHYNKATSY